jgi:hypothetical protein
LAINDAENVEGYLVIVMIYSAGLARNDFVAEMGLSFVILPL